MSEQIIGRSESLSIIPDLTIRNIGKISVELKLIFIARKPQLHSGKVEFRKLGSNSHNNIVCDKSNTIILEFLTYKDHFMIYEMDTEFNEKFYATL